MLNSYLLQGLSGLFLHFFSYFLFALEALFLVCTNWNRIVVLQWVDSPKLDFTWPNII